MATIPNRKRRAKASDRMEIRRTRTNIHRKHIKNMLLIRSLARKTKTRRENTRSRSKKNFLKLTMHIDDLTRIPQFLPILVCTRNVKSTEDGKMIGISKHEAKLSYALTRGKPLAVEIQRGLNLTGKLVVVLHTL